VLARLGGDTGVAVTEEMETGRRADPHAKTAVGRRDPLDLG
jgi:hypothetical protein